jgi:hypothetical protein
MVRDRVTAAGLLLQAFFVALSMTAEGRANDTGKGYAHARAILKEIKRLVPRGSRAWQQLFGRLYYEKRAVSFLFEAMSGHSGKDRQRLLARAAREYRLAAQCTHDAREILKVRGALALVDYLRLMPGPASRTAIVPMLRTTRDVEQRAGEAGFKDVERWASKNTRIMERGRFTGWTPYEVL